MEVILQSEKQVVVVNQQTVLSNKINRISVIDDESRKMVVLLYSVNKSPINKLILWEENDYDTIGNWTYEQVDERIRELL